MHKLFPRQIEANPRQVEFKRFRSTTKKPRENMNLIAKRKKAEALSDKSPINH
jgi:hypothetical protein